MGQFTDAGAIETNWHRFCAKDIKLVGSWGITPNDLPLGIDMLHRRRNHYPWDRMQQRFAFTEASIAEAVRSAMEMRCVKATIVPHDNIS
jgi:hypothetical protein